MSSSPLVAIVILNWNGKHYLEQFLPSVLAATYENFKIVVADNASTDDSVTFLKAHYQQIEVIQLQKNHGFAKGYNEALKMVTADYFVLLNSDVAVAPNWLQPIIGLMQNDETIAACQPKILSFKQKQLFEYAGAGGGWIDAFGYPFARGRIFDFCEVDTGQYDDTVEVFWATGAALVIKPDYFFAAGGFDEYFFAHQEEIDLCWRLKLMGKKIFCCPQSVVYHVGGGTLPRGNSKKTFLNFRNNQIMLAKNLPLTEKIWKIPVRLFLDQLSAIKGLVSGDAGYFLAIMQAHFAFFNWLMVHPKNKNLNRKKLTTLTGVYPHNIVWQHFAKNKKKFSDIVAP